jgi:hypothetical protein
VSREAILATWNARFWIISDRDRPVFTTEAQDVHAAIAEWLTMIAEKQLRWASPLVGVSIESGTGPWVTFPIGPAYRQAPESTRQVVRELMQQEFPTIANDWLETVGDEEYVAWRARNEATLARKSQRYSGKV